MKGVGFIMTMEMKEVLGIIIMAVLASAGVFGILLVLIIDKLSGVADNLDRISNNLHIMHNDTRDIAEMFENGVRVEVEEFDGLE